MKKQNLTLIALLAFGVAVAGCSGNPINLSTPGSPTDGSISYYDANIRPRKLTAYYDWLTHSPAHVVRQHYDLALARYEAEPSGTNSLRLALLLSMPDTGLTDYIRAQALLDLYLADAETRDSGDRGLALLMLAVLEQRELVETQGSVTDRQLLQEQIRSGSLENKVEELEVQVEQLKTIEQKIREKERQRYRLEKTIREKEQQSVRLEEKVEELETQVEQLKTIEETIRKTEKSINVPATPNGKETGTR